MYIRKGYCCQSEFNKMVSNSHFDLLHGRLHTFDSLFAEENLIESLDFDFIVSAINAIPLYKRLSLQAGLFTDAELETLCADANNFSKIFKEKLELKSNKADFNTYKVLLDPNETELEFIEKRKDEKLGPKEEIAPIFNEKIEEDSDETFLKYLYDPKGNNLLIPTLQKNINFTLFPSTEKKDKVHQGIPNYEDLEKLLLDISVGKYDHLARSRAYPSSSSSSSNESEEEISVRTKHLSSYLKFKPCDAGKFSFLKKISDDSLKINNRETMEKEKANFHSVNWLTSDDDSDDAADRKNQTETKRRPKRTQKVELESKQPAKPYFNQVSQPSCPKNKKQVRRKTSKTFNNSPKTQEPHFPRSASNLSSLTSNVMTNPLPDNEPRDNLSPSNESRAHPSSSNEPRANHFANNEPRTNHPPRVNETRNQNSVQAKKYQKSKRNIESRGISTGKPFFGKSNENHVLIVDALSPTEKVGASQFTVSPTLSFSQPFDGATSSKNLETKDQKQISNEMKSISDTLRIDSQESTESSDEDWESLAQQNLSVVDKIFHQVSKP